MRHIILTLIGTVLLSHTVFPHFHATETQNEVWCAPCPDSSQLLARIIHILDEHHPDGLLEYATSTTGTNATYGFYLPAAVVEPIHPQPTDVKASIAYVQEVQPQFIQRTTAQRGPPTIL